MGATGEAANRAALGLTNGSGAFGHMEDSSRSAGGGAPRNGYHSMEEQVVVDKALKTHQDTTASALRAAKVSMPGSQLGGLPEVLAPSICEIALVLVNGPSLHHGVDVKVVACLSRWCASWASAAWPDSAVLAAPRQSRLMLFALQLANSALQRQSTLHQRSSVRLLGSHPKPAGLHHALCVPAASTCCKNWL